MANYDNQDLTSQVLELRQQGLSDNLIVQELTRKGISMQAAQAAVNQADMPPPPGGSYGTMPTMPEESMSRSQPRQASSEESNIYERIEEITEGMIDEKWDELIAEVKKIIDWKEKIETKQNQINNDIQKLKDDFKVLHQGVLGKLEDYDTRMQDVGTELKAVGKVFKDVIPEFVENVKELRDIKEHLKG
ncbi:hypothetical protein COY27_02225 [Candidatus Woesearchaeota archaeon CG_4_10_14_0_2_um_filter_33_13]|nr:MAG: hypothetical protein COY27_02225 [Candidatus Woesearchaeota archaeon CG_4_10_14_0_2_um_filter_33_13]